MLEALYGYVVTQATESLVVGPGDDPGLTAILPFGFAYRVFVVTPANWEKGKHFAILLHHHKTEMNDMLYGFASHEERALFRDLIECDGVGPKASMAVLRLASVADISQWIRMGNADALRRAKGVNRGADNIIIKLQKRYAQKGMRTDDLI